MYHVYLNLTNDERKAMSIQAKVEDKTIYQFVSDIVRKYLNKEITVKK